MLLALYLPAVQRVEYRRHNSMQNHLRNTFLSGIFAAIPIAATVFIIYYIDQQTRGVSEILVGRRIPLLGVIVAIVAIYLLGLFVTSIIGKYILRLIDRMLLRMPILRDAYKAWKHVSITPGGKEGVFAKVVLIPVENGTMRQMGFTSGEGIDGDEQTWCVFVPAAPNPVSGRLYFVPGKDCLVLDLSAEEAFKLLISGGNYVPPEIGRALQPSPFAESAAAVTRS
jgi:uncharacterized membrane protein